MQILTTAFFCFLFFCLNIWIFSASSEENIRNFTSLWPLGCGSSVPAYSSDHTRSFPRWINYNVFSLCMQCTVHMRQDFTVPFHSQLWGTACPSSLQAFFMYKSFVFITCATSIVSFFLSSKSLCAVLTSMPMELKPPGCMLGVKYILPWPLFEEELYFSSDSLLISAFLHACMNNGWQERILQQAIM